jgi:hypothetical protein
MIRQADRSVRMAAVLTAGGFSDEAAPLLAKALAQGAGAMLARRNELPTEATMATPEQIRVLVETGTMPAETLSTLVTLWSGGSTDIGRLVETTAELIAALDH